MISGHELCQVVTCCQTPLGWQSPPTAPPPTMRPIISLNQQLAKKPKRPIFFSSLEFVERELNSLKCLTELILIWLLIQIILFCCSSLVSRSWCCRACHWDTPVCFSFPLLPLSRPILVDWSPGEGQLQVDQCNDRFLRDRWEIGAQPERGTERERERRGRDVGTGRERERGRRINLSKVKMRVFNKTSVFGLKMRRQLNDGWSVRCGAKKSHYLRLDDNSFNVGNGSAKHLHQLMKVFLAGWFERTPWSQGQGFISKMPFPQHSLREVDFFLLLLS